MENTAWVPKWARGPQKSIKKSIIIVASVIGGAFVYYLFFLSKSLNQSGDGLPWSGTFNPDKHLDVIGDHGAVASDHPLCSQMGVDVLKQGGTAADAAVQVALCIGTTEPQSSGIGGGGFITIRFPNGSAYSIDARETAPAAAHKHMFDDNPLLSKIGGLASGVPGELAGLDKLWRIAGSQSWKSLVEPIVELNKVGYKKEDYLKNAISTYLGYVEGYSYAKGAISQSDWCWLMSDLEECRDVRNDTNIDWVSRPKFAETLQVIADRGASAFYHGEIPEKLVKFTQKFDGVLTTEDFANYEVELKPVIQGKFRNFDIYTAPAPTSGPALLMGLNVMDVLLDRLSEMGPLEAEMDPVVNQMVVETMKWMAAARSELGDPKFIENPKIDEMLTSNWTEKVVSQFNESATLPSWRDYHPSYEINNPKGTSHFSVVDNNGMAVSMTTTVNLPFGNLLCDPETGVIMNSEMDDFSVPNTKNSFELAPSKYNFVVPGKRPLSSTVPSIITDPETGKIDMVIGAAGGSRILTSVFLAIVRTYGLGLSGLEALSFPRYHHQLIPEVLMAEPVFSKSRENEWQKRGHALELRPPASTMNLIHLENGTFHAVSDFYRKRGLGAAY